MLCGGTYTLCVIIEQKDENIKYIIPSSGNRTIAVTVTRLRYDSELYFNFIMFEVKLYFSFINIYIYKRTCAD